MTKFVLLSLEYNRVSDALRLYPLNAILATLEPSTPPIPAPDAVADAVFSLLTK
jgi:hypothetical protein